MKIQFTADKDNTDKETQITITTEGLDNLNFVYLVTGKSWYIVPIHELYEAVKVFMNMRDVCYERK